MSEWTGYVCLMIVVLVAGCGPDGRDDYECTSDNQCESDEICRDRSCVQVACKQDGDCATGERCVDYTCVACEPDCTGKCCGPDGCGNTCEDNCADTGQTCDTDGCECEGVCVPACEGKQCGPDGCGETCPPGCGDDAVCVQGTCQSTGCTSDADCEAPTPRCQVATGACVQCLDAGDCGADQICSGNVCADKPTCESDGQCEMGQICVEGVCLVGCRSNRDCPDGETCKTDLGDNGTCVECEAPGDCADGWTCEAYSCVPYCSQDAHCTPLVCDLATHDCVECNQDFDCGDDSGLICEGHVCVEGCRVDADCPSGICNTTTHQCVDCVTKDDCPLGNLCIDERCVTGCESDRDCPGDLLCDDQMGDHGACVECLLDSDCAPGTICSQGLCVFHCSSDADCADPAPACDSSTGTCVQCTENDHCDAGTICIEFACVPGCTNDGDCPANMVCDPGLGEHGACVACRLDADCPAGMICENNRCVIEGSDMIRIPGGSLVMGSDLWEGDSDEEPERTVTLPTFYIDRTEVTNDQYRACVQAGSCTAPTDMTAYNDNAKGDHPVVFVTRGQATDFCYWMGKSLPTEARWERAARGAAPDERTYPWGNGAADCARANYSGCHGDTRPVGGHAQGASPEGVLDMAGNVYEWIYDYYDEAYYGASDNTDDPWGPLEGTNRVARGGAFDSVTTYIRCANRASRPPDEGRANLGFRCSMRGSPSAAFVVTPEEGAYETTTFAVDASSSTDPNHPLGVLEVRWDWEADDAYDTAWTPAKTASHRYAYAGIFRIRVEVRDPDGNTSTSSTEVVAEGSEGWDGAICVTDQDCAHGFTCIFELGTMSNICRESCIPLVDPDCHIPGQSCNLWFDPSGGLGFACQPGN